jgi:hypothetical protein
VFSPYSREIGKSVPPIQCARETRYLMTEPHTPPCPSCGITLGDRDALVQLESRLFHAACAEAAFRATVEWGHASPTTLSEWFRGHGWGSIISPQIART